MHIYHVSFGDISKVLNLFVGHEISPQSSPKNVKVTNRPWLTEILAPDRSQDVMSQERDYLLKPVDQSTMSICGCGQQLSGTHWVQESLLTLGAMHGGPNSL